MFQNNFQAHTKGISSLIMLSEGTLISGGEKDRKIAAWDSLQNYKRITETKVLTVQVSFVVTKRTVYIIVIIF